MEYELFSRFQESGLDPDSPEAEVMRVQIGMELDSFAQAFSQTEGQG